MPILTIPQLMKKMKQEAAEILAKEEDSYYNYECPICGVLNDEWTGCGCYEDVHGGTD